MSSRESNFSKLTTNDIIIGIVHEILSKDSLIVDYKGSLMRVVNETYQQFTLGEKVTLRVMGIGPLRFKLLSRPILRSPEQNG